MNAVLNTILMMSIGASVLVSGNLAMKKMDNFLDTFYAPILQCEDPFSGTCDFDFKINKEAIEKRFIK